MIDLSSVAKKCPTFSHELTPEKENSPYHTFIILATKHELYFKNRPKSSVQLAWAMLKLFPLREGSIVSTKEFLVSRVSLQFQ
jgi:hypothetical protein